MSQNDPWGSPNWRLVIVLIGFVMIASGVLIGPDNGKWSVGQVDPAGWTIVAIGIVLAVGGTFARRRKNRRKSDGKEG